VLCDRSIGSILFIDRLSIAMGCNQSQSDDVRRDAERRRIQQQRSQQQQRASLQQAQQAQQHRPSSLAAAHGSNAVRTASTPIASPKAKGGGGDGDVQVGASYTDSRMEEHDFFKDIIDKAEGRMCDLAPRELPASSSLSAAAVQQRASLSAIDVAYSLTRAALPPTSDRPRDVASTLAAPLPAPVVVLHDALNSLADAVRAISIEDRGQLVVPWGETR
jgi:hypothetical protein